MKRNDSDLVEDVQDLVEQVVLEEVSAEIWKSFEAALDKLDPESRKLIEVYLNGTNTQELSRATHLPEPAINQWINQIKKELKQNIRKDFRVKQ